MNPQGPGYGVPGYPPQRMQMASSSQAFLAGTMSMPVQTTHPSSQMPRAPGQNVLAPGAPGTQQGMYSVPNPATLPQQQSQVPPQGVPQLANQLPTHAQHQQPFGMQVPPMAFAAQRTPADMATAAAMAMSMAQLQAGTAAQMAVPMAASASALTQQMAGRPAVLQPGSTVQPAQVLGQAPAPLAATMQAASQPQVASSAQIPVQIQAMPPQMSVPGVPGVPMQQIVAAAPHGAATGQQMAVQYVPAASSVPYSQVLIPSATGSQAIMIPTSMLSSLSTAQPTAEPEQKRRRTRRRTAQPSVRGARSSRRAGRGGAGSSLPTMAPVKESERRTPSPVPVIEVPDLMRAIVMNVDSGNPNADRSPNCLNLRSDVKVPVVSCEGDAASASNNVLVRVHYAGVNRPDVLQRQGKYPPPADASPLLGLEVSGEIVAVENKLLSRWKVGDKVCALVHGGGYAEYVRVPATHCLSIPEGLSMKEAACLPECLFAIWNNLFQRGDLTSGNKLLVHGGASGIGTYTIQIAKARGAEIAVTVGDERKAELCKELGADLVILYNKENFEEKIMEWTKGQGVDIVLDMVGGDYFDRNLKVLGMNGRLILIAFLKGSQIEVDMSPVLRKRLVVTGSTLRPETEEAKARIADNLNVHVWPLLESKTVKPVVCKEFPLAEAAKAHEFMESGQNLGKIVLKVDGTFPDPVDSESVTATASIDEGASDITDDLRNSSSNTAIGNKQHTGTSTPLEGSAAESHSENGPTIATPSTIPPNTAVGGDAPGEGEVVNPTASAPATESVMPAAEADVSIAEKPDAAA